MNIDFSLSLLLITHCILLLVKVYSVYFMASQMVVLKAPNGKNMMFVFKPLEFILLLFSIVITISELNFIAYYFIDINSFMYEHIAMYDEILFTVLTMYYIKKGDKNGD